jgi:glutaredoxin 3
MMMQSLSLVLTLVVVSMSASNAFMVNPQTTKTQSSTKLSEMKRPILDQLATKLYKLETNRVNASSTIDSKGRLGEPMEWSEKESLANQVSEVIASNSIGYNFKQFVADIVAGSDYDKEQTRIEIEEFISSTNKKSFFNTNESVAMYSFTSCPFCRQAKDYFDENNIKYKVIELDELEGNKGNEIRATLGKITKRTSVPSIFIKGQAIGGLNDGMPGLLPLVESGELKAML